MILDLLHHPTDLWTTLKETDEPIFLYGMGDGAEKVLDALTRIGKTPKGVYASDEFVRGHSFKGYPVRRFSDVCASYPSFIALLCFAVDYEPMLSYLTNMSEEHNLFAPDVPVIRTDDTLFDTAFVEEHEAQFDAVYNRLADEQSKTVYRDIIAAKLTGRIDLMRRCESSREEALARVDIGDPAVYDETLEILDGSVAVARAFDDRAGCYVAMEAFRRLARIEKLGVRVDAVATTQEEIGTRGAQTAAQGLNPTVGIAIDVTHATDHPDADNRKFGRVSLSGGPVICRGPNINPLVFDKLVAAAKRIGVPYQLEADARPTGTDARVIQMANGGVAAGLISVPLRYMHTPGEVVDLAVVDQCVQLLVAFTTSVEPGESFAW